MSQQASSDDSVRVALVLKPAARTDDGRASIVRTVARLGLVETGRGRASMSFRLSRTRFEQLFLGSVESSAGGPDVLGAVQRPGAIVAREPAVPGELAELVDAVSVEPPVVLMSSSEEAL